MLIHEIVRFCDNEYRKAANSCCCNNCSHPSECPGGCKNCLEQIHFPSRYPDGKKDYDCKKMMKFYVCDYINKYASEILYLLRKSDVLREMTDYRILSIGCGAAPDLMAFEQYVHETDGRKQISYIGMDVNPLWEDVHKEINQYDSAVIKRVQFLRRDAIQYFRSKKLPKANVIVLQYVISHFYNTGQTNEIKHLFANLVRNVVENRRTDNPFVIIINDVNSCHRGRDYFEDFVKILRDQKYEGRYGRFYFDYNIQYEPQRYGTRHVRNNTLFSLNGIDLSIYDPWTLCSSAQMIIEID